MPSQKNGDLKGEFTLSESKCERENFLWSFPLPNVKSKVDFPKTHLEAPSLSLMRSVNVAQWKLMTLGTNVFIVRRRWPLKRVEMKGVHTEWLRKRNFFDVQLQCKTYITVPFVNDFPFAIAPCERRLKLKLYCTSNIWFLSTWEENVNLLFTRSLQLNLLNDIYHHHK